MFALFFAPDFSDTFDLNQLNQANDYNQRHYGRFNVFSQLM
jgi:hypothetical protein